MIAILMHVVYDKVICGDIDNKLKIRTGEKMKLKKVQRTCIALTLTCAMAATPVFAAPEDEQKELEAQKQEAQSEATELQSQLNSLLEKITDLDRQLIEKGQQIAESEEELKQAQEKEKQQYEDLKLRIKYMYEEGQGSALERVLTSGSIAEVLTQAEYVEKVHTYDRKQLDVYQETVQEVKDLKASLESDQKKLQELSGEYKSQETELTTMIESKNAEVANLDSMIQEAAKKAAEKAAEEKRKAEEANKNTGGNESPADPGTGGGNAGGNAGGENSGGGSNEPDYIVSTGNAVVDRARSWIGKADYVWGACAPGAFDCSGFVSYCLTGNYVRLGTTATFIGWPQVSNPQPGDVCVVHNDYSQHTGIYVGNGMMIHAATYGIGVIEGPVQPGMIFVRY